MREYGIVLRAADVNMPTMILALASVEAACNNNDGFNQMLLSRIRASNFGQNTDDICV